MSSGEKPKGNIETNKRGWSELEEVSRDGYVDSGMEKTTKKETPEEKQEKVSQAKTRVEESYKKNNARESTSTGAEIVNDEPLAQGQLSPTVKKGIK